MCACMYMCVHVHVCACRRFHCPAVTHALLHSCIKMKTSVMIADMTVCPILHGRNQARGARASELIL